MQSQELPSPITEEQAADLLGVSKQTLARWRKAGTGPRPIPLPTRTVRYRLDEVQRFRDGELHAAADDLAERERAG